MSLTSSGENCLINHGWDRVRLSPLSSLCRCWMRTLRSVRSQAVCVLGQSFPVLALAVSQGRSGQDGL